MRMGVASFFLIFPAYILINVVLAALVHFVSMKFEFSMAEKSGNVQTIKLFVIQGISVLLVLWGACRWKLFRCDAPRHARSPIKFLGSAIYNAGVLIPLVCICAAIWEYCLGQLTIPRKEQVAVEICRNASGNCLVLFAIQAAVFAPIIEEIFFRGFTYRALKGMTTGRVANIATAFMFALLHNNIYLFLPLFAMSMLLVNVYERSGNIREPILIHSFFNATNMIIILCGAAFHGAAS
jgi:membrane protease YdiL (CAAX protease family)